MKNIRPWAQAGFEYIHVEVKGMTISLWYKGKAGKPSLFLRVRMSGTLIFRKYPIGNIFLSNTRINTNRNTS
jgi:hypothetical protein